MGQLRRIRTIGRLALGLLLYPLSILWPRSRHAWVFGHAGDLFAGNPKYLYLWLRLHRPDITATWITGSRETLALLRYHDLPVSLRWSVGGALAALRAGLFVFAHDPANVNLPLSRGARHLNLWHGVGVKALHTGAKRAPSRLVRWLRGFVYTPYDIVVSTSDMMQAHFARQFGLPADRCPKLGYPRSDCAFDPRLDAYAQGLDRDKGFRLKPDDCAEVYVYMPTFRDTRPDFLHEALTDLPALDAVLRARKALLYVKPHPRTADIALEGYAAITRWPDAIDIYTHLGRFTGLITDYSSVLYDYVRIKRTGVILYTFDFDRYIAQDRSLVHDFVANTAGLRVSTFDDLCRVLAEGAALADSESDAIGVLRDRFWGGSPEPASPAIVRYVEQELPPPQRHVAAALKDA